MVVLEYFPRWCDANVSRLAASTVLWTTVSKNLNLLLVVACHLVSDIIARMIAVTMVVRVISRSLGDRWQPQFVPDISRLPINRFFVKWLIRYDYSDHYGHCVATKRPLLPIIITF